MIGALEKKVPVLLIGWSHKYKEVLDMFEIGNYATDYKKLDLNNLIKEFERLEDEYSDVKNKIAKNLPKVKESSYKNIEIIVNKVKSI
jgi:polysaccharide pyruvyl transferase WcaK-like protein